MPAVSSPYGLRPIGNRVGRYVGNRRAFNLTTNNTTGIFNGDLVHVASGVVTAITATPTTTQAATTPVGVFVGCSYQDPVLGFVNRQYLPANSVTAGYTSIVIYVEDDPGTLFMVQADGAVAQAKIGLNAPLTNFSAGSTTTGNSKVQLLSGSIANTATLAVRIVDIVNETSTDPVGSAPGDAYTDVIVAFNAGVHAYQNATGA